MANDLSLYAKFFDRGAVEFNVEHPDFGASPDKTAAENSAAFTAAIAAMGPAAAKVGAVLRAPREYDVAGDVRLSRQMRLVGAVGSGDYPVSRINFPDGFSGVVLDGAGTSSDSGQSDWSGVEHLALRALGDAVSGSHGIHMKVRGFVRNVLVDGFSGNGIRVDGSLLSSEGQTCNGWGISEVRIFGCGSHGLYVFGDDGNCGRAELVDATSNGGWGIYDASLLGNTYSACHTANNTLGAYKVEGSAVDSSVANNLFLGCYSESGQPASEMCFPAVVIGGTHGAGITLVDTPSGRLPTIVVEDSLVSAGWRDLVTGYEFLPFINRNGATGATQGVLGIKGPGSGSNYAHLIKDGWWKWRAGAGGADAFAFSDASTPTYGGGHFWAPGGVWIGESGGAPLRRVLTGTAADAPTSGTYAAGTIYVNPAPTDARNISHWQCVTAGTPGTWRAHGCGGGTTAERPASFMGANEKGYLYFDTTLGKVIRWNGSGWDV